MADGAASGVATVASVGMALFGGAGSAAGSATATGSAAASTGVVRLRLPRLQALVPIVERGGAPASMLLTTIHKAFDKLEEAFNAQSETLAAVVAAQAAATQANVAATTATQAAATANQAVVKIENGDLDLAALRVNGKRFVESGGELVLEP